MVELVGKDALQFVLRLPRAAIYIANEVFG